MADNQPRYHQEYPDSIRPPPSLHVTLSSYRRCWAGPLTPTTQLPPVPVLVAAGGACGCGGTCTCAWAVAVPLLVVVPVP
ncbi:hypothetical protein KI387_012919, partial [Taxus chinensis]